jgi:hypothetical protein
LTLSNNYFVTGDYVVGGVGLRGLGDASGFASGTIMIPDPNQPNSTSVPAGADIVAAFLYWETVEKSNSALAGRNGFFNGFAITGSILGNPNAPTSWSSGGCSGSSQGTTTIRAYRADVRPFLPLDASGKPLGNGSFQVRLADSGSNGGGTPLTLGASLVIIYRVLSPKVPLNSIVLYDGASAPSNSSSTMSQQIVGFYQAAVSAAPVAKLTHIVGDGQTNKSESVLLNGTTLSSLYGGLPPFPGIYNGSWDNPTWSVGGLVNRGDSSAITSVVPNGSGSGCVDWGAVIFSTTVQDTDGDGLLDVWETNQGYTDAITNQFVALPGANPNQKDIFVELDYLQNLDAGAGAYRHSHLPKQAALDMAGNAFKNAPLDCDAMGRNCKGVQLHVDVGNVYQTAAPGGPSVACGQALCDPYIVPAGTGGNSIPESAVVCSDGLTLCQFPGSVAVGWKEGLLWVKNNPTVPGNVNVPLGNFQFGRKDSYHYVLFGHALGTPRSYWTTFGATLQNTLFTQLVSIVDTGASAVVRIQSPLGTFKPGDCPNAAIPACGDSNVDRVSVAGALGQPNLNGTYHFSNLSSSTDMNGVTTTTFTITTSGVADGAYTFSNEPRLEVMYGGPTSSSGHSDLGGADTEVTFGLWPADDPANCQADPSQPLTAQNPTYCNNQLGGVLQEAGTLMHEMGHTLTLTHGGTYYDDPAHPSVPTYELNCKSNDLSVMSYLFQVRGFPDGGIDYSRQIFSPLSELTLSEAAGIGLDSGGNPALHFTRWYAPPNALDIKLQNATGGRFAKFHCDGTPVTDGAQMVRVDGSTFSSPIDWDNDFSSNAPEPPWQDINFNGSTANSPDAPFRGFNDWMNVDLLQTGARENALGFSGGSGAGAAAQAIGGGVPSQAIGGGVPTQAIGGGAAAQAIGGGATTQAIGGGALAQAVGGGTEQDADTANSTADPPTNLQATPSPLTTHNVLLTWIAPGSGQTPQSGQSPAFAQVRRYDVWRDTGSFPTLASVLANQSQFTLIGQVTGTPPATTFTDTKLKNNTTYTYFVTDTNLQGVQSGPTNPPATIFVVF